MHAVLMIHCVLRCAFVFVGSALGLCVNRRHAHIGDSSIPPRRLRPSCASLSLDAPESNSEFLASLTRGGFDAEFAVEVLRELQALPVWAERDRCLGAAVRQLHRHTWFSTEGLAGTVEVATGTLAGSSLGDAIFTLAILGKT